MLRYLLLTGLLAIVQMLAAQPVSYNIALLSPALRDNAAAVRRFRRIELEIKSPESMREKVHSAVTIFSADARDETVLAIDYDRQSRIRNLKAVMYDGNGNEIRKFKEKEFTDQAIDDHFSLIRDDRIKVLDITPPFLPVTIEFIYEKEYDGFLGFPGFRAFDQFNRSVELDEYIIRCPDTYPIRHLCLNGAPSPEYSNGVWHWKMEQIPALVPEPRCPPVSELSPQVLIAPSEIDFDGAKGRIDTWQQMGAWSWMLLQGRDQLPASTVQQVRQLVAGMADPAEKVCAVYEFMQQRTRYVSIQLGIGGFQPFSATEVDAKGYGDCKALSNYTRALLAAADIQSYYAIVNGNPGRIPKRHQTFSAFGQDNHVILCVPVPGRDTMWLECTSQNQPCTTQGRFTSNRSAVLVSEQGGMVVPTARYNASQNREERQIQVQIKPDGSATGQLLLTARELAADPYETLLTLKSDEAANRLNELFPVNNARPGPFKASRTLHPRPSVQLDAGFSTSRLGAVQAGRLIFPVCPVSAVDQPASGKNRRFDIELGWGYTEADQVVYTIPEGMQVEFLPEPRQISSPFGSYQLNIGQEAGKITVSRTLVWHGGRYKPDQWKDLTGFIKQVNGADAEKVILKQ